mmetsp:Transcript_339/g.595  ORF Transcript_339/g.595 Transcript_339/m.595 type:complete len:324 (-) Transcript_339:120-1091(-)
MCITVFVLACWAWTGETRRVDFRRAGIHRHRSQQSLGSDQLHLSREVDAGNVSQSLATLLLGLSPTAAWQVAGQGRNFVARSSMSHITRRCSELQMNPPFATDDPALSPDGTMVIPLDRVLQEARLARPVEPKAPVQPEATPVTHARSPPGVFKSFANFARVCAARCTAREALSACLLSGTADVTVQLISHSAQEFDFARTLSFMLFGQIYCGAFQPCVYRRFDRWFGDNVKRKLLAEFLFYMPLVYIPSFYMMTGMLQGLGCAGAFAKLCLKYWVTLQSDLALWFAPMIVYFRWVPENYRVLYLSTLGMIERVVFSVLNQAR